MNTDVMMPLLTGANNLGPHRKEFLLDQAESEFKRGNWLFSIFYQVRALFQSSEERYNGMTVDRATLCPRQLLHQMNDFEREGCKTNKLIQYMLQGLKATSKNPSSFVTPKVEHNFLHNIIEPDVGAQKIEKVCSELPKEWSVLQLCKGARAETTYAVFPQIHEYDAPIYLTLLHHSRSAEFPAPICLSFSGLNQVDLYKSFANIANRFKKCVAVDPLAYTTAEAKRQYWDIMDEINQTIALIIADLQNFFFPWNFLFTGIPRNTATEKVFACVDEFCVAYQWTTHDRVLLSLAALHVSKLSELELRAICKVLGNNNKQAQTAAVRMLLRLQDEESQKGRHVEKEPSVHSKHYPCLLVIDERLDHFFWEELNVEQEFCRFNSLQSLWRLFQLYKERIQHGYLCVNITDGGCVVNPDNNLPKMEQRMHGFFKHWLPHWLTKYAEKPNQDELFGDYFQRSCYVYSGHGSGLQHINGKFIAKQQINAVVFLFGCDSARLHSNGLFSELVGPHLYYQAAKCPALVGTLMPGLDANMDNVTVEILSRWIAPHMKNVLPWDQIDRMSWLKTGKVKPASSSSDKATISSLSSNTTTNNNYHCGSLSAVVARVHQRLNETAMYNTVQYVYRGLPVWNCEVQTLPE